MRNRCTSGVRGQPGQLEPGEPPHAQSFGYQWVPAALGPVLHGLPVRPATEGEPVRPATPLPVRPAHGDRNAVDGRRDGAQLAADPVGAGVGGAAAVLLGRLGGDVQVDEHGPAGRDRLDQLRQVGRCRALRALGHGRDDQVLVPVVGVLRGHQRAAAPLGDLDVPQRPDPVVAPRHHLEHDRLCRSVKTPRIGSPEATMASIWAALAAGSGESRSSSARTCCCPRARSAAISGASKQR